MLKTDHLILFSILQGIYCIETIVVNKAENIH